MAVSYRHTSRETGVSCSSCGRPICPDGMTPTSVGMRCPECSREKTKVRTMRSGQSGRTVTEILIAINVIVFLAELAPGVTLFSNSDSGWVYVNGALYGPLLSGGEHEYWR